MYFIMKAISPLEFFAATLPAQNWWAGSEYDPANAVFWMVSGSNPAGNYKAAYSNDNGVTWSVVANSNVSYPYYTVRYSPTGGLVSPSFGNARVMRSATGGTSCTEGPFTHSSQAILNSMALNTSDNKLLYPFNTGATTNYILWTPGVGDSLISGIFPASLNWSCMAGNGSGTFVALADTGTVGAYSTSSPYTVTWSSSTILAGVWEQVCWTGNCFFALRKGGSMRSYDGITWETTSLPQSYTDGYGGSGSYAVENWGQVAALSNGTIGIPIGRLSVGGNLTDQNIFVVSKDNGDTWKEYQLPSAAYWRPCSSNGTHFVVGTYTAGTSGDTRAAYSRGSPL